MPSDAAIEVMLAVTPSYLMPAAVTLRSAGETLVGAERIVAHVFCDDTPDRARLVASLRGLPIEVRWHAPSHDDLRSLPSSALGMSVLSFERILAAERLETADHRLLYLDADLLVRTSLGALWDTDLGGCSIAAAQDDTISFVSSTSGVYRWREIGFDRCTPYFNAGVLLIDQDRWRIADVTSRCLSHYRRWGREVRYFDQETLNAVLGGDWIRLEARWNATHYLLDDRCNLLAHLDADEIAAAQDDPSIVHFTGPKPWKLGGDGIWRVAWFDVVDRTAWSGFRPTPPGAWDRARHRVRKATRVLRHG